MSDKNPRDKESPPMKLPSLVKYQSERAVGPQSQHRLGRLAQLRETAGQRSTRYEDFARDAPERNPDRNLRPLSRIGGKQIQRRREEELKKRDEQRLDAFLSNQLYHGKWLANSKSETSLFKVPIRSERILKELCNDGFITTHRHGGLAFDVSLGGRPLRLSPIGRRSQRSVASKKRKKTDQRRGGKRKKRDKKRRKTKEITDSESDVVLKRGSEIRDVERSGEECYDDDRWEDVDEEEDE